MNSYEICEVPKYDITYEKSVKYVEPINSIVSLLNNDKSFHERLHKNDLLKLCVDVDKLKKHNPNTTLDTILNNICKYVGVTLNDISYTTNYKETALGSHHIVIPSLYMVSSKQKTFWKIFREKYGYGKEIDADIFNKECWFRLPNQTKGLVWNKKLKQYEPYETVEGSQHFITKGNIEDFILKYIEKSTLLVPKNEEDKTDDESVLSEITLDNKENTSIVSVTLSNEEETYNDIDYLLNVCIQNKMCDTGNHTEWNIIGQALKNELGNEATEPFLKWTLKYGSTNKKNEAFSQITKYIKKTPLKQKDRLTIKSIHYYAKKYNADAYYLRFKKIDDTTDHYKDYQIFLNNGDYGLANYFCKYWGHLFKSVDIKNKRFYGFNKKCLWEQFDLGHQMREIMSNEMYNKLIETKNFFYNEKDKNKDDEMTNEELSIITKRIEETLLKLMKTNEKNNITRELTDKLFDNTFENLLNKQKYILPIKNNKIFNMKTLEVTDRTINDLFSYECNANFVSMNELQEDEIRNYFLDLFCGKEDTMKVVLNIFKSILSGETLRYIYFFTGSGSNGKSLLFSILNNIFNKSMDTIDTRVILESKSSNLTTEFEKLDKCRIGYVTELKEKDVLNTTLIKKVSGGDTIDYRGLYQSNKTIKPTCNLCVLTNKMPSVDVEKAIMNRIIVIPFNNTFETNNAFETIMLEKRDLIFSFIMKYGIIQDKFDLTEEMIIAKEDYKNDNIKIDYLELFLEKHFELVTFEKKEKIMRDDFRTQYNEFLKSKGQSQDNSSNQKFTRLIREKNIGVKESHGKTYYTGLIYKTENELDNEDE